MTTVDSLKGRSVLLLAHVAGMIDMVALPVWVGTALIGQYKFSPQQAGGMVTLYLLGAVVASVFFASRFTRFSARLFSSVGYGIACLAFLALTQTRDFAAMAVLHLVAGLAAGTALSFTHGTIGRSPNPHRLFAIVGLGLCVAAIIFLGGAQQIIPKTGGTGLFTVFAAVMALATLACAVGFPSSAVAQTSKSAPVAPLSRETWLVIFGVILMALNQAMLFSFVERIGFDRGYGDKVTAVLIATGFVNLLSPILAGLLQHRLSARSVTIAGPMLQAVLACLIVFVVNVPSYAIATAIYIAVMIFTHTFAFGLLAKLDTSGRAAAATAATLMTGAAIGPILGGVLVQQIGYPAIAIAVVLVGLVASTLFARAGK
jgi:predicted MFS family arabinose efflux permease